MQYGQLMKIRNEVANKDKKERIDAFRLHMKKVAGNLFEERIHREIKVQDKTVRQARKLQVQLDKSFGESCKNQSLNCLDVCEDDSEPVCGLELWGENLKNKMPGGEGWVRVRAVIDSGAGASVGPKCLAGTGKLRPSSGSKAGQKFTSASGEPLKNEGEVVLPSFTEDGLSLKATFQIADITRPLLSVSKICEKGNLISFGANGGVIMDENGRKTYFGREKGIYVLELFVRAEDMGF